MVFNICVRYILLGNKQDKPSNAEALSQLKAMFPQASLSVLDSTLKHMSTLEGAMEHLLSSSGQSGKGSFAFIFSITLLTDQGNIRIIVHIFTTDGFMFGLSESDAGASTSDSYSDSNTMPNDLPELLTCISPKHTSVKRITVNRDSLLADSICAFKTTLFDFDRTFRITFENEAAIDGGGPTREYFTLVGRTSFSI